MTTTSTRLITATELEAMDPDGERYELIRGELREVRGVGLRHGGVGGDVFGHVWLYATQHDLGTVFLSDTRFVVQRNPDSVTAPDVAFVRKERLPSGDLPDGYGQLVPDLVVEIVSPSQYEPEVMEKVRLYLEGGVRLIWVVHPRRRLIREFRPDVPETRFGPDDELDGHDVLPGFRLPMNTLFRI